MVKIPFNKPYFNGKEATYIKQAVENRKLSGNGLFTNACHKFFEERYGFKKCLLATSCTDALEMAAILAEIKPNDEVILPTYTFVSSANAFVLRGAKLKFADSSAKHPNVSIESIKSLISDKTKAILVVHYGGVACDMKAIMDLSQKHKLIVVEDAAQAIDSRYKQKVPLGSIGHLAAFSFHESKNISSGEGGMLVINDSRFAERAEIIWEKGTNRTAFWRGEVDHYGWMDIGSSFLPSEITAAFLFAQTELLSVIQHRRTEIWHRYNEGFEELESKGLIQRPFLPDYASNNGHLFYLLCSSLEQRDQLISHLLEQGIQAVFHYLPLHGSPYFSNQYKGPKLENSKRFSDTLVRLPLYYELKNEDVDFVINEIRSFFE